MIKTLKKLNRTPTDLSALFSSSLPESDNEYQGETETKDRGEPCEQGEAASRSGCIPASGKPSSTPSAEPNPQTDKEPQSGPDPSATSRLAPANGGQGDQSQAQTHKLTEEQRKQARLDYAKVGTMSKAFKSFFGDWQSDPKNASKVVTKTGEPAQTGAGELKQDGPKLVFHGTPHGSFEEFSEQMLKDPDSLVYGPGFYFTEDAAEAEHYAKPDEYERRHGGKVEGKSSFVLKAYLNVRKPFDIDKGSIKSTDLPEGLRKSLRSAVLQYTMANLGASEARETAKEFDRGDLSYSYTELAKSYGLSKAQLNDTLKKLGHDGMTVMSKDTGFGGRHWVIFDTHQAKSVENDGTFDPSEGFSKDMEKEEKGEDEPCKQGETASRSGCIPASGDSSAAQPNPAAQKPTSAPVRRSETDDHGSKDNPIVCGSDVNKAAKLLAEGKHVRLSQPEQVSTLVDKMASMINDAIAKGEVPPHFDLCKVSVAGANLFCEQSKGIPRVKMPQMRGIPVPGSYAATLKASKKTGKVDLTQQFLDHLTEEGIKSELTDVRASYLRASQNEIVGARVAQLIEETDAGDRDLREKPIFVTRDNYIVDGHHHWAAIIAHGADKGKDYKIPVYKLNMDIIQALDMANEFTKQSGLAPKTGSAPSEPKSLEMEEKGEGEPCASGETAARSGCVPATSAGSASPTKNESVTIEIVEQLQKQSREIGEKLKRKLPDMERRKLTAQKWALNEKIVKLTESSTGTAKQTQIQPEYVGKPIEFTPVIVPDKIKANSNEAINKATAEEQQALWDYTGYLYNELNAKMRGHETLTKEERTTQKALLNLIDKMPKFERPLTVYRGIDLRNDLVSKEKILKEAKECAQAGKQFKFTSFTSTSIDPEGGTGFGDFVFHIVAKSGLYVDDKMGESEIIQSPHTNYKVVGVSKAKVGEDDRDVVYLEEI